MSQQQSKPSGGLIKAKVAVGRHVEHAVKDEKTGRMVFTSHPAGSIVELSPEDHAALTASGFIHSDEQAEAHATEIRNGQMGVVQPEVRPYAPAVNSQAR